MSIVLKIIKGNLKKVKYKRGRKREESIHKFSYFHTCSLRLIQKTAVKVSKTMDLVSPISPLIYQAFDVLFYRL